MDDAQAKTVGEMLRAARESRQLAVEQAHRETRIPVHFIRALEADDFGALPSETHLKGFLRSYADFLGLDGGKLWSMVGARASASAGGGPAWDVEEGMRVERLGAGGILRRVFLPALLILVVVLAVMLVRERRKARVDAGAGAAAPVEAVHSAG